MTAAVALWSTYVDAAVIDVGHLDAGVATLAPAEVDRDRCAGLAHVAFRLGMSSLLVGVPDVGRLALAIEQALDRLAGETASPGPAMPVLSAAVITLRDAVTQLAHPDESGARVEALPLIERRAELEAIGKDAPRAVASRGKRVTPALATVAAVAAAAGVSSTWVPTVEDDMIELFFDEAAERLEGLASKLVELERRPEDADLVRDVFRDLHTVKGSSAMVGLGPVNQLAHAAEDLVGQVRDSGRPPDGSLIDAVRAALDGLRGMLGQARARVAITIDPAPIAARLRNPGSAPSSGAAPLPPTASASRPVATIEPARQTIRVDFDKLDGLVNLVGELVLARDDLRTAIGALASVTGELAADRAMAALHLGEELDRFERVLSEISWDLDHGTERLDAISSELREQVMKLRMVPVAGVFRKHVRTVRDLAASLGKRARLELQGDDTELDKLLVEALDEPLMHLVRNAVDHGLEPPDVRLAAGKPAEGVVRLEAAHRGNQVTIRLSDDGRGMVAATLKARAVERGVITEDEADAMDEPAALALIFRAGFSTAATVSEVSGRGVGMDVVRQTIVTRLNGTIDLESSPGKGTAVVLRLPLTLAIIQVLVARAGGEVFCIPIDAVIRVLVIHPRDVRMVADREVVEVRGKHVPLIRLDRVLELGGGADGDEPIHVVLTAQGGHTYGLVCDHLVGKKEIVINSLGPLPQAVPCAAGATLLGDRCALILDVPAVVQRALNAPALGAGRRVGARVAGTGGSQVLLVEDSDIVREALRRLLVDAGYLVTVAVDGQHGLEMAKSRRFELISTDVMMPRMDGYELTRSLRAMPEYADTPIVMVTSRGERIDRVRGRDAGVDEYITKPHDRRLLLRTVRTLLGHTAPEGEGATEGDAGGKGDA